MVSVVANVQLKPSEAMQLILTAWLDDNESRVQEIAQAMTRESRNPLVTSLRDLATALDEFCVDCGRRAWSGEAVLLETRRGTDRLHPECAAARWAEVAE